MKTRMITQICLTYVMICCLSFASPPSLPERNFDFSFQALEEPSQLGDILTVNWSFVLHHEADSLLEAIYSIDDSAIIAKAYIFTSPGLEYVSGDTLWWGHIKHDETHAFTASYRVVEPLIVGLRPIVETHAQPHVETLRTRTAGEGCRFDFRKKRKRDSTILLTANGDTVIFSNDVILPTDFARIDTNLFRKPWLEDTETARPKGFSDEIVLNLDGLRNNDTVEIPIMRDSILRITFMQENPSSWKIRDTDSIMQLMDLSEGIQLLLKTPIKERILHIDFENGKSIFLRIKSIWMIDGYFRYNDPFGTNNNPLNGVHCFFYERIGDHYEQVETAWTAADGYFCFYTDKDDVIVAAWSANELAFVCYAEDSCFDFAKDEVVLYHGHLVGVYNPSHSNQTVPDAYAIISDLSLAGAFHILDIFRHASATIEYPNWYTPWIPIYFLDLDTCIKNSAFGGFAVADVPGIQIKGSEGGNWNDWDQWDSLVVLHELGHFLHYDTAQLPPNIGGSHTFTLPLTGNNKDDLASAWTEAFATFMAGLSLSTSTVINYGFPIPDTVYWLCLERPKPDVPYYLYLDQTSKSASTPYFEGAHVEGSVCLALWDLYDAIDDGDYYVGPDIWGHNDDYNAGAWWQDWDPIIDVFCNFDPQPDNPDHDFCWTIYEFIHGWRNLGYPIDSTFINIFEAHNVPVFLPGDADDGGTINILDVGYITAYLYSNGPPPDHMSAADANADCTINILDVDYLIDYLYVSGPEPLVGCYNYYPS